MTVKGRKQRDGKVTERPRIVKPVGKTRRTTEKQSGSNTPMRSSRRTALQIGWREWIGLPGLNIEAIRAKIDTGARSSSLHAKKIELFNQDGQDWVRFDVVLDHAHERGRIPCVAPVTDVRLIRNSFGVSEERVIIRTLLQISNGVWPIELSLADRENMTFPALLGRTAIRKRAIIDPGRSYLCKRIDEIDLPPLPPAKNPVSRRKKR